MIVTNVLTILLVLVVIWKAALGDVKIIPKNVVLIFFLGLYGIILLGFFYPIESGLVWVDLEKKLSLLVLPIVITIMPLTKRSYSLIFEIFFWSGAIASAIALLLAAHQFFVFGESEVFFNHYLSGTIGLHATYMGLFLLFSFSYLVQLFKGKTGIKIGWRVLIGFALISVTIILLGVRIIWVMFFLSILYFISKLRLYNQNRLGKTFFLIFSIVALSGLFLLKPVQLRLLEAINYKGEYGTERIWGGRGIRVLIWTSALELIAEKPIFGYGTSSSVLYELENHYKEQGKGPLLHMIKQGKHFNAHNQYLEEFLKHGLILGSLYILFLVFLLIKAFRNRDFVALFLTITIITVSLTETIFELNKGIIFISFLVPMVFGQSARGKRQSLIR